MSLNRGGDTNFSGAPVDSLAPAFGTHKLNDPESKRTLIESMTAALANPAFNAKWGDTLRAKHPALARAAENAAKSVANPANAAASRARAADGNFMPKGMEATPYDGSTRFLAEGEQQRNTDPRTVAGLDGLMGQLARSMDALLSGLKRRGGLPRVAPTVQRKPVTTTGIRGQDEAARNAARRDAAAQIEAAYAMKAAVGDSTEVRTYWDAKLGVYRPV